jgi:DNA-binding NarL/FixJ family response regulator
MKRRVLVVEDDVFVNGLLCESLAQAGFDTCQAHNAAEARRAADRFDPDAALIDIDLGDGPTGIDLARVFAHTRPELVAVMLTARASSVVRDQLPAHVGFIRKSLISEPGALTDALDQALRAGGNGIYYDIDSPTPLAALSASQREVLRLITLGLSNAEIAKRRAITQSGAEQAVSAVFRGLGLQHSETLMPRVEAARIYIEARGLPRRSDDS